MLGYAGYALQGPDNASSSNFQDCYCWRARQAICVGGRLLPRPLEEGVACILHLGLLASSGVFVLLCGHRPEDLHKTSTSLWESAPACGNSSQAAEVAGLMPGRKGAAGEEGDAGEGWCLEPGVGRMHQITVSQAVHLPERPRRE